MNKTELEIIIDEEGQVHIDIKGIKGKKCLEFAEMVEKILGEMRDKRYKPEYYEEDVVITEETEVKKKDRE